MKSITQLSITRYFALRDSLRDTGPCVLKFHPQFIVITSEPCVTRPVQVVGSNSCSPCASSPAAIPPAKGKSLPNGSRTLWNRGPGPLFGSVNRLPLSD